MPNLKLFKRRSSGNALEFPSTDPPAGQSSFKVLERPERASTGYHVAPHKGVSTARSFQSPLQQLRGKSADDLGLGVGRSVGGHTHLQAEQALKGNRGSGGTTNSGSSGYYESSSASARHSSTSTLPSSVDQEREAEHEELYPQHAATTPMQHSYSAHTDEPLPPPPSFKSRAARTFSFGQKHIRSGSVQKDVAPLPPVPINGAQDRYSTPNSPLRDRSETTSSYASTAKPPPPSAKLEQDFNLDVSNFGDDFGNMFAGVGRNAGQSREALPLPPAPGGFHRTVSHDGVADIDHQADSAQESEPMYPPPILSRQSFTPSPNAFRSARDNPGSPYSNDGRNSQDGLMSNSALSSPRHLDDAPPPPAHGNGIAPAFLGRSKTGYALVPERNPSPGLDRRSSESTNEYGSDQEKERDLGYNSRQTQLDDGNRWGQRVDMNDPQVESSNVASNRSIKTQSSGNRTVRGPTQTAAGATRHGAISPTSEEDGSIFGQESISTTPRATRLAVHHFQDEALFDSSPVGPPSRAIKPGHQRTESGTPRKMTKAQFEAMQRSGHNSLEHSEEETHDDDDEEDDEDETERAKQLSKQRRKQEANMSVYRQQMKKVTGGGPADLAGRPPMERAAASAPSAPGVAGFYMGGVGGPPPADSVRGKPSDDEDEDVPLGVLQAHGFPGGGRPPTRQAENDQLLRGSLAGSVVNGGAGQGNLPPFARRLPADPYFGAGLVNGANRESLAFSSAQSVYGGAPTIAPSMSGALPPQMQQQVGHPGGLVGVIASEERAKASRRGSPNPVSGTYGMPLPMNMPGQMPSMPRTMSMGSMVAPQVYTPSGYMPGMPSMPAMPGMPSMPSMMPPQDSSQQQMQKFFDMQMQFMQNMLAMQQQQMGTPQPQLQTPDYLGVPFGTQRPASIAPTFQNGATGQGRAMTMMSPPPSWDFAPGAQRPLSAMPNHYAPSAMNGGGPGPGYTPSIAPSERSNVGMPTRYRPVATTNDATNGRSHSMTSSMTLQAFTNDPPGQGQQQQQQQRPESRQKESKSTIRVIDKAKGGPKVTARPVADEDEDDGWAEMSKKRTEKKFGWRGKKDSKAAPGPSLSDLYSSYE